VKDNGVNGHGFIHTPGVSITGSRTFNGNSLDGDAVKAVLYQVSNNAHFNERFNALMVLPPMMPPFTGSTTEPW